MYEKIKTKVSFSSNAVSKESKKRQGAINELIQTEKAYVQDMSIVHEVFELPLRKSKIISTKEIDEIFVNWQDILQCNKNFLTDLTRAYERRAETIGDVICQHVSYIFGIIN